MMVSAPARRSAFGVTRRLVSSRRPLLAVCTLLGLFFTARWIILDNYAVLYSQNERLDIPACTREGSFDPIFTHPHSGMLYSVFQKNQSMKSVDLGEALSFSRALSLDPDTQLRILDSECLDNYFEHGKISCVGHTTSKMDVVWSWVNGSDPLVRNDMIAKAEMYNLNSNRRGRNRGMKKNHFREHDELRFSIRSIQDHFQSQSGDFYIVSTDIEAPCPENSANESWRLGQLPQRIRQGPDGTRRELKVVHHGQIFTQPNGSNYNSLAIESQLHNIPNLSEYFIYMNDDTFFLSNFEASDFYTNAFGVVLRMQSDLMVKPHMSPKLVPGEWQGLEYSNMLLSDKFGERWRPYGSHQARILSTPLLTEISLIWDSEILGTASRPFRGVSGGRDFYIMWLFSHFVVERWREALLWSWIVGSVGREDGGWDGECAKKAWEAVGGKEGEVNVRILKGKRETLSKEAIRNDNDFPKTRFAFAAADGYPYTGFGRRGAESWFPSKAFHDPSERCILKFDDCFASDGRGLKSRSDDVFKRIAFEKGQSCGDCIITALVNASGPLGLSAFLPSPNRTFKASKAVLAGDRRVSNVPMLPLAKNWHTANYGLENVLTPYRDPQEQMHVRPWVLRLLWRYRFVIGETPSLFHQLMTPTQVQTMLTQIPDRDDPQAGLLCVNDDVGYGDLMVGNILTRWMSGRWSTPLPWELD